MTEEKTIIDLASKGQAPPNPRGDVAQGAPEAAKRPQVRREEAKGSDAISEALNELLSKVEAKKDWVTLKLPSNGVFNEGVSEIEVRPFVYEDERILRSVTKASEGLKAVETLMERCVRGISYRDLSLYDKHYLLFKLREISYGAEYPVEIECQACGEVNALAIQLDQLVVNYASEDHEYPKAVKLPDSEVTAFVTCPRAHHERMFSDPNALTEKLWQFVERLDGYNDRGVIQAFLSKTTAKDITLLRQEIFSDKIGIDTNVRFKCRDCNADEVMTLPMNENFFSVS